MKPLLIASQFGVIVCAISLLVGCQPAPGNTASPTTGNSTSTAPGKALDAAIESETNGSEATVVAAEVQPPSLVGEAKTYEISFDDLICNMQEDIVFRPWMLTDRVKELDGQRVRLAGFMLPDLKREGIVEFVLLRNIECKFGPGGKADHLVRVKLLDGVTAAYKGDRPLDVVGTLKVNPYQGPDGNTWCIYDLDGESVQWKRR